MSSADPAKALADFWTKQGEAFLKAQEQTGKALADGMQVMMSGKLPEMPEISSELSAGAAELAQASQSMTALWSAATALSGVLATALPPEGPSEGGDATIEAILHKVIDPRSWMSGTGDMEEALGRMAEGPRMADLWDVERRYARVLRAWMTVRRRGLEHQTVVLDAWLQAGKEFSAKLTHPTGGEKHAPDSKAMLALWTETANRHLLQNQRSEPYLQTQAAMIRASTELRLAQQDLVEHFGRQYGFPTRTELDDVHRTVSDLRRELRAMRREQRLSVPADPNRGAEPVPGSQPRGRKASQPNLAKQ